MEAESFRLSLRVTAIELHLLNQPSHGYPVFKVKVILARSECKSSISCPSLLVWMSKFA